MFNRPAPLARALTAFLALGLATFVPTLIQAGVTEVWWEVTYVQDVNPDGLFPRRAIGVNGTWPPPPLEVSTNDTLLVHATNRLDAPTTLHHHGMFFNGTSWYDGAQGVTQCGIPPGASFTYVVAVNETDQRGTYWVHAHASGQYVDGLRAPLLLHPPAGNETYASSYNAEDDYTVILGDWYHQEHAPLLKHFMSRANPGGAEPVPDSGLIYFSQNGSYLPGFNENASLPFVPGRTYRLRVINTSAFSAFFFYIDGHDMRIIEVDGTDVEESPIDVLSLTVAQRYSVLVTARNDTNNNWGIHANMDTDMFDTIPDNLIYNISSQISYNSSATLSSSDLLVPYHDVNDTALVPIPAQAMLPPATHSIPLVVSFDTMTDGTNHASFNATTYNSPVVPSVFSALSMQEQAMQGLLAADAGTIPSVYGPWAFVLQEGETVDLVVMNSDAGKHPFHLHGHKFQIVQRSTDYISDDPALNPPIEEGQANPIRRDTVQIQSGTGATLRFQAGNPGTWFFHCHIEWHLEAGLAITLISSPATMLSLSSSNPSKYTPPQSMYDQCASQGMPTTGNAAGRNSTTDLKGLQIGPFLQNNGWHSKGIGALAACIITALLGMGTVCWYALGERITDEEWEEEVRRKEEAKKGGAKAKVGALLGRFKAN